MPDTYARIDDHAIIGDGRSAALVARDGAIDWLCWPRFDSSAVFARLLDPDGGAFVVAPAGPFHSERQYLPDTNVLETRFTTESGTVALLDCMPVADELAARKLMPEREILRIARCDRGEVELDVLLDARPGFGRAPRRWRDAGELGLHLRSGRELFAIRSEPRLALSADGAVRGRIRLRRGETARFSFTNALDGPAVLPPLGVRAEEALARTIDLWREWVGGITYRGPFRGAVVRSALVLKLLAHTASGAIVAAPTTSLPERLGGFLNWDYRYCWLRDASLTSRALFGLGVGEEAQAFVGWLMHSTRLTRPALHVLYDVYGRAPPRERVLDLDGYAGSRPVRIGNAAKDQLQLDTYGEVVGSAAQLVRQGFRLGREASRMLAALGEYVARHWREPDESIWEPRYGRRQHTFSKVLCWSALDRLIELHDRGHLARAKVDLFTRERAAIREAVERHGWNEAIQSYTQIFDSDRVDAALLQLPWYGYIGADTRRMRSTYQRIEAELGAKRGLLYRYRRDREWREGAFGVCGFWAAEYLALGGGSAEAAESRIASLLGFANDVGLFGEETDPVTGEALGNFPQAFTHVGLINACLTLRNRVTGREQLPHRGRLPHAEELKEAGG